MDDRINEELRYKLRLTFDADQIMDDLQFDIVSENNSIMEISGKYAGAYCFKKKDSKPKKKKLDAPIGSKLDVEVVVLNTSNDISKITLVDLTLVCKPGLNVKQHNLSPYCPDSAGCTKSNWTEDFSNNYNILPDEGDIKSSNTSVAAAARTFNLVDSFTLECNGCWEIAGYLSVRLSYAKKPKATFCRVYLFDPIVVVGGGGSVS